MFCKHGYTYWRDNQQDKTFLDMVRNNHNDSIVLIQHVEFDFCSN
jgi:hypothetical protein